MTSRIAAVDLIHTRASRRTTWTVLRLTDAGGVRGYAECSEAGRPGAILAVLRVLDDGPGLLGRDSTELRAEASDRFDQLDSEVGVLDGMLDTALAYAAADLDARHAGAPLWSRLGGEQPQGPTTLYANLNRGVAAEPVETWAVRAAQAAAEGFTAVKISPFVELEGPWEQRRQSAERRLRAVREAVGDEVEIYVDLHAGLDPAELWDALPALSDARVAWLEDPFALDRPELWAALRERTEIPLAGGEGARRIEELCPLLDRGLMDTVLPDVRLTGGPDHWSRLVTGLRGYGVRISPHNPLGPVATATALHASTLLGPDPLLEYAYGEVPWRGGVISPPEQPVDGALAVPPGPGLGIEVLTARCPGPAATPSVYSLKENIQI
jgi:galactonate dehydratase